MSHHRFVASLGYTIALMALAFGLPPVSEASEPAPIENGRAISPEFPYEKSFVQVNGARLAYVDAGAGPVVLLLHGNPTSSYLWRNIIPYIDDDHRVIALDLVGMGDSDKPDIGYTFRDHATYVDAFISALALENITLLLHDWGSALGMRYAHLNPDKVRGVAFMEALLPPTLPAASYEAFGDIAGPMFQALRAPGLGEELVYQHNFFVESVLGRFGSGRALTDNEMAHYRAPFATAKSRKPTLVWPRQVPIAGEPREVAEVIRANGRWLYDTDLPKLLFHAQPGALIPPYAARHVIAHTKNLTAIDLGPGSHFLQESSPHPIGEALATWLETLALSD